MAKGYDWAVPPLVAGIVTMVMLDRIGVLSKNLEPRQTLDMPYVIVLWCLADHGGPKDKLGAAGCPRGSSVLQGSRV